MASTLHPEEFADILRKAYATSTEALQRGHQLENRVVRLERLLTYVHDRYLDILEDAQRHFHVVDKMRLTR